MRVQIEKTSQEEYDVPDEVYNEGESAVLDYIEDLDPETVKELDARIISGQED